MHASTTSAATLVADSCAAAARSISSRVVASALIAVRSASAATALASIFVVLGVVFFLFLYKCYRKIDLLLIAVFNALDILKFNPDIYFSILSLVGI